MGMNSVGTKYVNLFIIILKNITTTTNTTINNTYTYVYEKCRKPSTTQYR